MKMVAPELAAVIAGVDAKRAFSGPSPMMAAMPARIASPTASGVSPSMTISSTLAISRPSFEATAPLSVGQ